MWYVVQVNTGMEEKVCTWCRARIAPSVLEECFVPRREERRKVQGEMKTLVKTLFPGYIILVSDQEKELYEHLKEIPRFTRILGTGREVVPLTEREIKFLQQFCGKNHVAEMSEGIIEGDRIKVLTGPLEGLEAYIKKIDRHKRKAYLELEMFGRIQTLEMGLEVAVKKIAEDDGQTEAEEAGSEAEDADSDAEEAGSEAKDADSDAEKAGSEAKETSPETEGTSPDVKAASSETEEVSPEVKETGAEHCKK